MSPVPRDDNAWRELIRGGQPPSWRVLAEGSGGSVWKREGVLAAMVPLAPERSVFNSVFYRDPETLLDSLDEIDASYAEAGVRAWTVWVPEADTETARALEAAGHKLDAEPHDMGMALADLREPEADPDLEIVERDDYAAMARINEAAYGYPAGDFEAVERASVPAMRIYFGVLHGTEVATLAVATLRSDAIVAWVAALPEARGRGVSGRLLARALVDARAQGLETTTLQSTKLGFPVYAKLGYRDFGAVHMWEKRREGVAAD
jgi:GNAT superfamily N-acetyltransferase